MKVLVTGASGFVGNYVVKELLKNNFEVVATSIDIKNKKLDWIKDVNIIERDLNQHFENDFEYFNFPDILIHLSWERLPNYNKIFHFEKNLFSNYNFIKNMITHGLRNVSIIGTCFEYGKKEGCLFEDIDTCPTNSYGLAKDTLRKFIQELQKIIQFNFKWIRLFYTYGEGQNKNSILEQLKLSLNNKDKMFNMSGGEQLRDYLPIEKVAEYIVKISTQNKINGIINCCSGKPISIRNLVENYLKENNKEIQLNLGYYPYNEDEPFSFWGDITKLNKIL